MMMILPVHAHTGRNSLGLVMFLVFLTYMRYCRVLESCHAFVGSAETFALVELCFDCLIVCFQVEAVLAVHGLQGDAGSDGPPVSCALRVVFGFRDALAKRGVWSLFAMSQPPLMWNDPVITGYNPVASVAFICPLLFSSFVGLYC